MSHRKMPTVNALCVTSDRSSALRDFKIRTACGSQHNVVSVPAAMPIASICSGTFGLSLRGIGTGRRLLRPAP
jgi:hypothetical protein